MMKQNYQKQLDSLLDSLGDKKPSLLLHACCGPCSSYVLEYLYKYFNITVFYYNPNIYPEEEYHRRLDELKNLYTKFPPALEGKIKVIEENYDPDDFYKAVKTKEEPELAGEKERGERCRRCYEFRLKKTYEYALKNHFDYFCTTLSISPFKDAEKINVLGKEIEAQNNGAEIAKTTGAEKTPLWLTSDFKKKGGFKRSLELSEEYGMYRQQYCGCIYSLKNSSASE
jgi:predicted adenine nucleotide alpha hydrolase (AANH) superfamily ATPase